MYRLWILCVNATRLTIGVCRHVAQTLQRQYVRNTDAIYETDVKGECLRYMPALRTVSLLGDTTGSGQIKSQSTSRTGRLYLTQKPITLLRGQKQH